MNIKNIIKDLSYTGYTKEIIRHEAIRIIEEQDKEIERLNNIIDELEKEFEWQLKKQIDIDKFAEEQGFLNYNPVKLMVEHFKNKLKELKEGK